MRRTSAVAGSIVFLVIAPGTLAGLVPWALTGWRIGRNLLALRIAGGLLIVGGLLLLLECFGRFALEGRGTPAPVAPAERLVVSGPYRRVRNPMYAAVTAMILGQSALFAAPLVALYGAAVWLGFHTFVLAYEEPRLRAEFPAEYPLFAAAVPRWIPRLTRWRGY